MLRFVAIALFYCFLWQCLRQLPVYKTINIAKSLIGNDFFSINEVRAYRWLIDGGKVHTGSGYRSGETGLRPPYLPGLWYGHLSMEVVFIGR